MASIGDMVKVGVLVAPGTGTIQLGDALPGFESFNGAGVPTGTVSYGAGDNLVSGDYLVWEVGRGTYNSGSQTLTRGPLHSSNGGSAVDLGALAAVWISILSEDLPESDLSVGRVPVCTTAPTTTGDSAISQDNNGTVSFDKGIVLTTDDPGTAPGAGKMRFAIVAGTDAGTAKVLLYAGTSVTPIVLADNVGSGF